MQRKICVLIFSTKCSQTFLILRIIQRDVIIIIIIIILQRYGPFSLALASPIIDAHSSLSNAFVLQRFTPSFLKSSSTSSIHLSLGRPLPLLPSNFPSKIFFTHLLSFILITCPSHSNLQIFITVTISWDFYLVINSKLVLILHCPFSFVGPYKRDMIINVYSSSSTVPLLSSDFDETSIFSTDF